MNAFLKTSIGSAVALASVAIVTPAQARNYDRGYDRGYQYDYNDNGYYDRQDYRRDQRRHYNNGRRYYQGDRYYYNGRRCSKGTTGTILGAVVGGLLGREVVGRRGDRTAGAIVGAGAGALAGRAIERSDRRC